MQDGLNAGRIVYSAAGRDAGRYYIICGVIDENFVTICDGDKRRLEKPKKKKLKHLKLTNDELQAIGAKLSEGRQVFDSEIRSALRPYNERQ